MVQFQKLFIFFNQCTIIFFFSLNVSTLSLVLSLDPRLVGHMPAKNSGQKIEQVVLAAIVTDGSSPAKKIYLKKGRERETTAGRLQAIEGAYL